MVRLSIQTRQLMARLMLPLLIGSSCALMLLSRLDAPLGVALHVAVADRMAPIYRLLCTPIDGVRTSAAELRDLVGLAAENRRLRAENGELRRWVAVARSLAAENQALKANLHWLPLPGPHFVTARAVADTGGIYGRAVLLAAGSGQGLHPGEVALDADGLVGRISEVGVRSSRVLLITDPASRVPVLLETSHASAMAVGNSMAAPRLLYYAEDVHPVEGEHVVTSSAANAYPAGLSVGVVHYLSARQAIVLPSARLDPVDVLRIFDYGLSRITPPAAPGHVLPGRLQGPPATSIGQG